MLGHGFVDDEHGDAFGLDESDPIAYGVVRIPRLRHLATIVGVVSAVIVAVVVIVLLV